MINLDENKIKSYLSLSYSPEYHFLKTLQIDYPHINGVFRVPLTFYASTPLDHLSQIELDFCINQMASIGLLTAIKKGQISKSDFPELKRGPYTEVLIGKSSEKFIKKISPLGYIYGNIKINELFSSPGKTSARANFDFENGKCTGDLSIALILAEGIKR